MALYKHGNFLTQSNNAAFDKTFSPSTAAPYHGIYKCTGCGDEIAIAEGNKLPPQNHKQHNSTAPISWQLIVYSQSTK